MSSLSSIQMISASAGTGKTYRLTELIVEAVKAGTDPERIMATTFTVKAAAELKRRVRGKLLSEVSSEIAPRIEDAYIGTVHSLCSRFLSEYAIDAGISPAVDMLPEQDAERLFAIAVEDAIARHAGGLRAAAERCSLTGRGFGHGKEGDWQEDVRSLVDQARSNGFGASELAGQAQAALTLWWRVTGADKTGAGSVSLAPTTEKLMQIAQDVLVQLDNLPTQTKGTQKAAKTIREILERSQAGNPVRWRDWLSLVNLKGTNESNAILENVREPAARVLRATQFKEDFETLVTGVYQCAGEALTLFSQYKRLRGLMDFGDLEVTFLELIEKNESVRAGLKGRVDLVLVDEFQDTSPVQLAIFLQINEIVGRSIWVGDPKQAIYGFRGTDPSLMASVAEHLKIRETLQHSWRSRERVIEFTNALFRQTFHDLPASRIELTVPKAREADAAGGAVGAWYLDSTNNENDTQALASGVADLLCQNPDLSPGDVAILCRANKTCGEVAQALEDRGVRTSIASGALTSAREVQLLLAALRFLADESDSIALSELVLLSPDSGDNNNDKQLLPSLIEQPEESLEAWRLLPVPAAVSELRSRRARLSPAELLDAAISATGVMEAAESWSRGDLRRANIDRLQKLVDEYEELQTGGNRPATLLGFVKYVEDLESGQAEGDPASGCVVSTYHGAKGLEWPVVIMAELSKHYSTRMFQVSTVSAQAFDAENPLANRQVRYWPWPFGGLKKFDQLDTLLEATPVYQETARIEQAEAQRLLYVGMTRARDQLVLAVRNASGKNFTTPSADWLDVLADQTGAPLIQWPAELGAVSLPVGNYSVAVEIQSLEPDACGPAIIPESSPILRPVVAPLPPETQDLPRWITASGAHGESAGKYTAVELAQIGAPLQISVPKVSRREAEQAETTDLGNAIHTVFGIAHRFATRDRELVLGKIKTVLEEWNVTGVDPQELWRACSSLDSFIEQRYAATAEYREHPVTMRLPNHQELRGWIDLLLETPDGWVIIDHKAYAGDEPEQVAAGYGQQLAWYRTAVQAASGKAVSETLIHFPVLGKVFGVTSGGYRE